MQKFKPDIRTKSIKKSKKNLDTADDKKNPLINAIGANTIIIAT